MGDRRRDRQGGLSMAQRLASMSAQIELESAGRRRRVDKSDGSFAVFPTHRVWTRGRNSSVEESLRTCLAGLGRPAGLAEAARVGVGGREVTALAVRGLTSRELRWLLFKLEVDVAWIADGGVLRLVELGPDQRRQAHDDDAGAFSGGVQLAELLAIHAAAVELPSWRTADRLGWVYGGPLEIRCDACGTLLEWCDWWHAAAVRRKNTWFAYCPIHGGPVRTHGGRSVQGLIDARRRLDAALQTGDVGLPRNCYVIDVEGLEEDAVYVGETSKCPAERLAEHRDGVRAGKVFRRPGVRPGALRPDLLGDIPRLFGDHQSQAAEQWVAARLAHAGMTVFGGH